MYDDEDCAVSSAASDSNCSNKRVGSGGDESSALSMRAKEVIKPAKLVAFWKQGARWAWLAES